MIHFSCRAFHLNNGQGSKIFVQNTLAYFAPASMTIMKNPNIVYKYDQVNRHNFKWSGQVRSGQVRSGQVRSGQVRSGQVRSGQVRSDWALVSFQLLARNSTI
jgi:hypothetical protein